MAFVATDWSIAVNGDIRYTGDAHAGTTPSYATVIEFHRALQDFADDAAATGNDLLDISSLTPSDRSTDNIITLLNSFNIDQTGAEHLYDGSIIQDNGNDIWDGIVNFGNASYIIMHQNGTVDVNDFWNSFTPAGFNSDANQGISHRFMIQTRSAGADTDGRRLRGLVREFSKTYSEFPINGTSRGNNVLALSEATDLNNATAEATVAGYTSIVNNNEGYSAIDINNDGADDFFYSEWDLGTRTINDFYERTKWLTRRGNIQTVYGLGGDVFRGVTHQIVLTAPTDTFQEPEEVSWSGGTGQLLAIDSVTAGTAMWIQLLTGTIPDNKQLTGSTSGATAQSGVVTARTISNVFSGVSTGSSIIGAYGLGIEATDVTASDKLFDLDNVEVVPPNNVTFTVLGLVVGEDRVMVGPETGGGLDKAQFSTDITLNGAAETSIQMTTTIPSDTPVSGTLRIVNDSGFDKFIPYASFTGSTFTFTSAENFSGTDEFAAATVGSGAYITYIDKLATLSSETFTVVFNTNRALFIRVRDGGASPIKTFETTGTLGSAGGSTTVIRTTDL